MFAFVWNAEFHGEDSYGQADSDNRCDGEYEATAQSHMTHLRGEKREYGTVKSDETAEPLRCCAACLSRNSIAMMLLSRRSQCAKITLSVAR